MSNLSSINVLGSEFTRYIAVQGEASFYFSEKKSEQAIIMSLAHFPSGPVLLGIQDTPESLYDISDLRQVVNEEKAEALAQEVLVEVEETKRDLREKRHSNHWPRQAAYFAEQERFNRSAFVNRVW